MNEAKLQFDYRGWQVAMRIEGMSVDGYVTGRADLSFHGAYKCRVTVAGGHRHAADVLVSLGKTARMFIDDWLSRDHSGTTGFYDL